LNEASSRLTEMINNEERCKDKWEAKYADRLLTSDQLEQLKASKAAAQKVAAEKAAVEENRSRKTEKQCSFNRLAAYDDEPLVVEQAKEELGYEKMRKQIAAEVARTRMYNSRMSGDLSTESMLADLGPGLCSSFAPGGYCPPGFRTANRDVHFYKTEQGWGEKVNKAHFNTVNEMSAFAEAALKLGEKPFKGGGMK